MKRKLPIMIIPAAIVVAGGLLFYRFRMAGDVTGAEAHRLVAAGARLIDVRSPAEFQEGHLPGAVNIPVATLPDRLNEVGPKEGTAVLYCRSGFRSGRAAALLRASGFSDVRNLGPMRAW